MIKQDILANTSFGERVAEEESEELASYFVETDQFLRVFSGKVDIIYGAKGSGKSAIYSLIVRRAGELAELGIRVIPAENPRGATVFGDLVADPPTTENELRGLWKIYFLSLVSDVLRTFASNEPARKVLAALEEAQIHHSRADLNPLLISYVGTSERKLSKAV